MADNRAAIKQALRAAKHEAYGPTFSVGTIEDSFAHAGTYIVRMPAGPLVQACDAFHGSALPVGARPVGGYPPKSRVLCMFDQSMEHAVILAAVPRSMADSRLILPDSLVLRSRVGQWEDPMHYTPLNDPQALIGNFSMGRPADSLPGDWGYINELGVAVFIGKLMASLRGSDNAKVEAFWGDDLLRLVGYNYELFTAGREAQLLNDEGEYNEVIGITPYPWEGLGARKRGTDPTQQSNGKLQPGSENAQYEPKQKDQLMVPRMRILRGYLGDLERIIVSAPPDGSYETYASQDLHRGLAEKIISSDGTLYCRSAKAIVSEKYSIIPVPKMIKAPEDPEGDSVKNGYQPAGTDVQVPEYKWSDLKDSTARASELYDYLAWFQNRFTTGGLAKKKKDWHYPQESDVTEPVDGTVYDQSLDDLDTQFIAKMPTVKMLQIDHRGGRDSVSYYKTRSTIAQLDDGSVIIEAGWGEQIVMSGGNIKFSCPGDIWNLPGRSAVTWAPFDAILRAGNSAEVSAAKKDVRIKAERNLHCLAGNSQEHVGGILLESRSEGLNTSSDWSQTGERVTSHGVVIKCPKSSFHVMAGDGYIGLTRDAQRKTLCIDAGDEGEIYLRGKDVISSIKQLFAVLSQDGDKRLLALSESASIISTPINMFGGTVMVLPGDSGSADLIVGGNMTVHQSGIFNQSVITNGGYAAVQGAPYVAKLPGPVDPGPDPSELASQMKTQIDAVSDIVDQLDESMINNATQSPGSAEFVKDVGFSCRDSEKDVKLDESTFVLHEARWQQLLRLGGAGSGKTWDEPVVTAPTGEETMPHPGKQAWKEWSAMGQAGSPKNFDYGGGKSKGRDGMSETGSTEQKTTLSGSYKIIKKPD